MCALRVVPRRRSDGVRAPGFTPRPAPFQDITKVINATNEQSAADTATHSGGRLALVRHRPACCRHMRYQILLLHASFWPARSARTGVRWPPATRSRASVQVKGSGEPGKAGRGQGKRKSAGKTAALAKQAVKNPFVA